MTPATLYERKPESMDHAVGILNGFYYNHVPELAGDTLPDEDPNKRVQIRYYQNFNFDGRRFWRLASVWYATKDSKDSNDCDWKPFMIIQNAGREGDDHHKRFVTDAALYEEAARYLKTIVLFRECSDLDKDVVDPLVDVPKLTEFYGNELDGYFERARY